MARLSPQEVLVSPVNSAQAIPIPEGFRKAERAYIYLQVLSRDPVIGRVDFSRIIPREFTGRWYLYQSNYQTDMGAIDFKAQRVYADYEPWLSEQIVQSMAQRVPLIETTQPEENFEELSEFLIFSGNTFSSILSDLNIPIIGDVASFVAQFLEDVSSDNLDYFPKPNRPDTLYIDVPQGKAEVEVKFVWFPYSPITFGAGIAEVDISDEITPIDVEEAIAPESPIALQTFDESARAQGYIPIDECVIPPEEPGVYCSYLLIWQITSVPTFQSQSFPTRAAAEAFFDAEREGGDFYTIMFGVGTSDILREYGTSAPARVNIIAFYENTPGLNTCP